ncbi:MAG: hypothetical protein IJ019_05940 [Alphaproteobacteria bacterium]|nr:hypothetical protein [Alphaproteobacteria bacterium]
MRKYFLLSAVAILMTNTATAETDYANVMVSATLTKASAITCSNLNFGNIIYKDGTGAVTLDYLMVLYFLVEIV